MKRKWLIALIALVVSVFCCGMLFGCGEENLPDPPEVKNVTLTAEGEGYGKVGVLHRLSYDVPAGCEISMSVQRGEAAATSSEYNYRQEGFIFFAEGEYTVTVYAAKGGSMGSGAAKITVTSAAAGSASVEGVGIRAAANETYGTAGALHIVKYTASAGSDIEISVTKGGEAAADAVIDAANSTVIFGSAGEYTVTVTAKAGTSTASASANITVTAAAAPKLNLKFSKTSAKEEETVSFTRTAELAVGDKLVEETFNVFYRKSSSSGNFLEAEEENYKLVGEQFMPLVAGTWRIEYHAVAAYGGEAETSAQLTCRAADLTLTRQAEGRQRIQTDQETEIGYYVTGAPEKYDVSFDTHGREGVTAVAGMGTSVRVKAENVDYFTVTVIYTHKITKTTQKKLDIEIYSVENLTFAPLWGEDPFDGMPDEVLTNMGYWLYYDATLCGGSGATPSIEYSVKDAVYGPSQANRSVEILNIAGDERYPYLFVNNLDDGDLTGSFTLKMTLTDPFTGYSAVAEKGFTIVPTSNENATAAERINAHIAKYPDFYNFGALTIDGAHDMRLNMALTKTGGIAHRLNAEWPLGNGNTLGAAETGAYGTNGRLEFDFTLYGLNGSGAARLGIQLFHGSATGGTGYFNLSVQNGAISFRSEVGTARTETIAARAEIGIPVRVRIDRTVSGSTATYTVSVQNGEAFQTCMSVTAAVSTSAGNLGAPVTKYQFDHRDSGGCFAIENVTVSPLI